MRIGVFGGTFDPIHTGHLIVAEVAREALPLDLVVFVPAGQPWRKMERDISPAADRVEMVRLAIASNPFFALSLVDVERGGPSYTADTMADLIQQFGSEACFFFLAGLDAVADLPNWHQPQHLLQLCQIVALKRPGYVFDLKSLDALIPEASTLIQLLTVPEIEISSTELQRRIREGRTIRYLVPMAVEQYIRQRQLSLNYDRGGATA